MRTSGRYGASHGLSGALTARNLVFPMVGRLVSVAVLTFAILRGRGDPLLFLWGLWCEEILSLLSLSVRKRIVRRRTGSKEPRGTPLGMFYLFATVHAVFILFFSLVGAVGLFSGLRTARLPLPSARSALAMVGALVFWTAVDIGRAVGSRWNEAREAEELDRIDREARLAIFLPHVTIIAGGLCLVVLRLGDWMSWGILAGKVVFEILAFFVSREPTPEGPRSAPDRG